jgi:hypothetical protein
MTAPMVAGSAGLRFPLGHSGIPVRRLLHGQVEGQFVFQFPLHFPAVEQGTQA